MNNRQSLAMLGHLRRHEIPDAHRSDVMDIAVFDFLSHDKMHHAFNESYLRLLQAGFPGDRIVFYARPGHIARLAERFSGQDNVSFAACAPFEVPFGLSRHNPVAGRMGARACVQSMLRATARRPLRLVSVLGVDANLLAVLRARWPHASRAPLHMILHSQLGDSVSWRSRNPFIRAGDFVAQLRRPLPPGMRLVALELGVKEAIAALSPAFVSSVDTLEHPILAAEWSDTAVDACDGVLRIAFLGHASRTKGFHHFTALARQCRRPDLEFQAIGIAAAGSADIDVSGLSRKPVPDGLPRDDYLAALAAVDMVCLPIASRAYDFIASGTVCDAIAALKPILALRTRPLDALFRRYGPMGQLGDTVEDLAIFLQHLTPESFAAQRATWIKNIASCRAARRPEALAQSYAEDVLAAAVE